MKAKHKIIPIFIPHAGCPNQCVFCNQKHISGSLFPASARTVRQALLPLEGETGCELAFYGGSFTAIDSAQQEELLAAVQPFRASGLITALRVSTRPDAIDHETLRRLQRYGVETVELGAQSMTDSVLRLSGRGHTAEDTRRAVALLHENGFRVILQMMTGLPGETMESAVATARELAALRPEGMRIYPAVIIRDTPMETMWRRGEYREHTVEDAVEVCAEILPILERAGIRVIRLGLNPTDDLSGGDAVAGAYHPALGELVRARVWRERAQTLLRDVPPGSRVTLGVQPAALSQLIGQRRENLRWLRENLALEDVRAVPAEAPAGEILLLAVVKKPDLV